MFGDDNFIEDVFERIGKTPPSSTDIRAVIAEICKLYKLKRGDLTAPGKGQLASEARAEKPQKNHQKSKFLLSSNDLGMWNLLSIETK